MTIYMNREFKKHTKKDDSNTEVGHDICNRTTETEDHGVLGNPQRISSQFSKLAVIAGRMAFADFVARETLEGMCSSGF